MGHIEQEPQPEAVALGARVEIVAPPRQTQHDVILDNGNRHGVGAARAGPERRDGKEHTNRLRSLDSYRVRGSRHSHPAGNGVIAVTNVTSAATSMKFRGP